jgi:hypothetical protein
MHVTIKAVNQELAKHEIKTILVNGGDTFSSADPT